jgi:hypothetical protein
MPPQPPAECGWALADGLEGYTRPDAPRRPPVCLDETSQPSVADTRVPRPAAPGQPARRDDEDARQGPANRVMVCEPWAGQRWVTVTARRPAVDCAPRLRELGDEPSPHAAKMVLVMDPRHTPTPASLYEACTPAEARRWSERLERHDTPTHGRWVHRAATACSVLAAPCVERRIPDAPTLAQEVAAWARQRKTPTCRIDWRFTAQDARITLKRLYPSIQLG